MNMLGKIFRVSIIVGVIIFFVSLVCGLIFTSCQDDAHNKVACKAACGGQDVDDSCYAVGDGQHLVVWCPTDAGSPDHNGYKYLLIDKPKR